MAATVHSRYIQTVDRRYSDSRLNRFSSSERGLITVSVHFKIIILRTQLTLYCYGCSPGKGVQGLFVLGNERSREQTVQGTNVSGNEW